MTGANDGTPKTPTAVWCGTCGIPYAADTVYCANCAAPLADDNGAVVALVPAPTAPTSPFAHIPEASSAPPSPFVALAQERLFEGELEEPSSTAPLGVRTLDDAFPNPPRGLLDRVRQRQQTMSDDEIDAAAAAIIAQARHADRLDTATGAPRDARALLADPAPDPAMAEALRQRRERDRAWLIGGIACCVLLIVVALIISRSMSVGMLRQ